MFKAEGCHQGFAPILFKGFFWFLSFLMGLLSFNSFRMVVRQMSFILLCGTTIVPLNNFDNFVYISLYLYGGNVHFFAAYPKKLRVRGGENTGNHPSEPPKHRTSLHKTSDVCGRNLGTFHRRSPMFSGFRTPFLAEIPENPPFLP